MTPGGRESRLRSKPLPRPHTRVWARVTVQDPPREGRREEGSCPQGPVAADGPDGRACLASGAPRRALRQAGTRSPEVHPASCGSPTAAKKSPPSPAPAPPPPDTAACAPVCTSRAARARLRVTPAQEAPEGTSVVLGVSDPFKLLTKPRAPAPESTRPTDSLVT